MYTKNEKEAFARRVTLLAQRTDMPYDICMALGGEEAKVLLLKDVLLPAIENDLSDLSTSFLFNKVVEHINIDSDTGKVVDSEIPYHYMNELKSTDIFSRCNAIRKVLRGITGSSITFSELEIAEMSKRNASAIADYMHDTIYTKLLEVCISEAIKIVDPKKSGEMLAGVFYVRPGVKHLKGLWVLKYLGIKKVVLPYGVTLIRPYTFENTGIEEIVLSRTVSHIQKGAFFNCNLKEVVFPENKFLNELGFDAFTGNKIQKIICPKNITTFDFYSFRKNPLKEVSVSKGTKLFHTPENITVKEE